MNTRICSVIASVTLLTLSSGCGGTRNFLFGRGARCGACRPGVTAPAYTSAPTYGPTQPVVTTPNAGVGPVGPYQPRWRLFGRQPRYQTPVATAPTGGCGCNGYQGDICGGHAYADNCCCGDHGVTYGGDCHCGGGCGGCGGCAGGGGCGGCGGGRGCGGYGGFADGYGQVVTDPYLQGDIVGGTMPYNGQIISDPAVGGQVIGGQGYPSSPAPIQSDNFNARKFDSDGNRILWEEPLPQGTTSL